jgi:GIY-YIG catalytic domain
MILTDIEIEKIMHTCDFEIKSMVKIKFSFDKKWTDNFPKQAGIYAIFRHDCLVYIGETANLKERMKEVKRTLNHSFRRKLGKHLNSDAVIVNGKFEDKIESDLDFEFENHISFTYKIVNFGRLEIESALIHRNEDLLNSIGKRNKINHD